jgi:hypothetical protein
MWRYLHRQDGDLSYQRRVRLLGVAAIALYAVACGGSTEPNDVAVGTYVLVSVNGSSLPALKTGGGDLVLASTLTLEKGGVFTRTTRDSLPPPLGPHVFEDATSGQWSVSGSSITLTGSMSLTGSIYGGTINVSEVASRSNSYQFERQ